MQDVVSTLVQGKGLRVEVPCGPDESGCSLRMGMWYWHCWIVMGDSAVRLEAGRIRGGS